MTALFAEKIALAKLTLDITPYWRYLRLSDMSDNRNRAQQQLEIGVLGAARFVHLISLVAARPGPEFVAKQERAVSSSPTE